MSKSKTALNEQPPTAPPADGKSRAKAMANDLAKWNRQFHVEYNQNDDMVVLSAARADVSVPDLRKLCDIIGDDDYTLSIVRSGDKVRITIW